MASRSLSVAVVGLRGVPEVMGGVETHCQHLYPALLKAMPGTRILVYARRPYVGSMAYEFDGVDVLPLAAVRRKGAEALLHTLIAVLHAAFVQRPDLLHVHAVGPALFTPLARAAGLRVLATHHGRDYRRAKWGPVGRWALRLGESLMVRCANEVICVSDDDAEALRHRFPSRRRRIHAVPNGVELPPPVPDAGAVLRALGIESGRYVLAVGRLVPEKGFHDLVAAHQRAATRQKLVIVGAADHEDRYSTELRSSASPTVIFAGLRRKEELRVLYENASLFVLPSYHEGLPLVALEAMLCGSPCLLSDIPANRQLGLPDANYVRPGDVEQLKLKLGQGREIVRPADASLLGRYSWSDIALATSAILRKAVA